MKTRIDNLEVGDWFRRSDGEECRIEKVGTWHVFYEVPGYKSKYTDAMAITAEVTPLTNKREK